MFSQSVFIANDIIENLKGKKRVRRLNYQCKNRFLLLFFKGRLVVCHSFYFAYGTNSMYILTQCSNDYNKHDR